MNFKVGDLIRFDEEMCEKHSHKISLGKIYRIIEICPSSVYCRINCDNGFIDGFTKNRCILVNIPNNPLSKIIYPNYIESECGQYLLKKEYK